MKSGPQVGELLPGPFHPLNVTGAKAGEKHCLYCEFGPAPVAMIFARTPSDKLTALIKKIDAENEQEHQGRNGQLRRLPEHKEELGEATEDPGREEQDQEHRPEHR